MDYLVTIGSDDPRGFSATSDAEAIAEAVSYLRTHALADLQNRPESVVTLMGPNGLVTRPSERLDEFVERLTGSNPASAPETLQPGDTNTPDCNGD